MINYTATITYTEYAGILDSNNRDVRYLSFFLSLPLPHLSSS